MCTFYTKLRICLFKTLYRINYNNLHIYLIIFHCIQIESEFIGSNLFAVPPFPHLIYLPFASFVQEDQGDHSVTQILLHNSKISLFIASRYFCSYKNSVLMPGKHLLTKLLKYYTTFSSWMISNIVEVDKMYHSLFWLYRPLSRNFGWIDHWVGILAT